MTQDEKNQQQDETNENVLEAAKEGVKIFMMSLKKHIPLCPKLRNKPNLPVTDA